MIIWCKLQRGEQIFEFGLLSWLQYLSNKCQIRGRFQSVRFLTPIELSNFPSDTKIIKKQAQQHQQKTNFEVLHCLHPHSLISCPLLMLFFHFFIFHFDLSDSNRLASYVVVIRISIMFFLIFCSKKTQKFCCLV